MTTRPDSDRRSEIYRRLWDARSEAETAYPGLRHTPELLAELQALRTDCQHERWVLVRYKVAGGAAQARKQCTTCGDVFGGAVRAVGSPPDWDAGRLAMWVEKRAQQMMLVYERHAELQRQNLSERRAEHAAYLQTQEWKRRRRLVMERAGGLCEGCRLDRATEVHHLTYKHWGRELLFELVALCENCHGICHEDRDSGEAA